MLDEDGNRYEDALIIWNSLSVNNTSLVDKTGVVYIAGSNGISWGATRIVFDGLQSKQSKRLTIEGISSRNAQYLGWCMGYYNNSPAQQSRNTFRSFKFY